MGVALPARGETARWNGGTWRVAELTEGAVLLENVDTGEREQLSLGEWFGGTQAQLIQRRIRPSILTGSRPRKGAFMRWNNATWRVLVVRSGIISLQNTVTDETSAIAMKDWQTACYEGEAEMVSVPGAELDERTRQIMGVSIDSMPESMREPTKHAALFFEAWRNPRGFFARYLPHVPEEDRGRPRYLSKRHLAPFLELVATAHGVEAPGASTWCKWLVKVDAAGGDIRAICPRRDLQGPHVRYMNPRVEQWLHEAVDKVWLQRRKNKKNKVHAELHARIEAWNGENADRELVCPSAGHVARWIREEVDRYVVARRRGTQEEADREFKQVGKAPQVRTILERVEVDHSFIKIQVRDDQTGVVLGYPWLTAGLDKASRMPLAAHLNFENQSLGANFQCLRQIMSPKAFLPSLVPHLDYDFPSGVPESFYFDHGTDYDNDSIRRIGLSLDVLIDYEPVALPEYKGAIERFWRTLKEDVIYGLAGAKLPGQRKVSGVDEDGEAWITYSELSRRIWEWISMVYAKSYHRGINDIPLRVWQEQANRTLLRALPKKTDLNILLTHVVKCPVSVRGVTYDGLTWSDGPAGPLNRIMRHPSFFDGMEVEVRFDEYDLSKAWVVDPFTLRDEELKPLLSDYMRGLSLHAHDRILKNTPKAKLGTLDQRALVAAKTRMRNDEQVRFTKAAAIGGAVGTAVAKFAGIGQQAPAGDSLGGVLPEVGAEPPVGALVAGDAPLLPEVAAPTGQRPRIAARKLRNDD